MNKLSFEEFSATVLKVDESVKENNGHSFIHILKSRCQWCGRSPRVKGRCSGWFNTFIAQLAGELTGTVGVPERKQEVRK